MKLRQVTLPICIPHHAVGLFNKRKPFVTSDSNKENAIVIRNGLLYRHCIRLAVEKLVESNG